MRWVILLGMLTMLLAGCGREDRSQGPAGTMSSPPARHAGVAPAEMILQNATLYTGAGNPRGEQAIAVRDGRIVYLGVSEGAEPLIGPSTQVDDLDGKLVLPGIFDPRLSHYAVDGLVNLYGGSRVQDYQQSVAQFIAANPGRQLIVGKGWQASAFGPGGPHKDQLDQVNDLIPIVLFSADHQSVWVNSEAIAAAGINMDTPDPQGGSIARDTNGLVIGVFRNAPAMALVESIIPRELEEQSAQEPSTPAEAVAALVGHGVFASGRGGEAGGLELGQWADFTLLDQNPFKLPPETLRSVRVLRSYHRGRPVYQRDESE